MRTKDRGFSLLELLIVMTVMLIIAAIAIPKFLAIKQQSAAAAAIANLHAVNNALAAYASNYPQQGYPSQLTALGPTTTPSSLAANLVDESLSNATTTPKQGYLFAYGQCGNNNGLGKGHCNGQGAGGGAGGPIASYELAANPLANAATRYFYTDETAIIRYNDSQAAVATDPPIG